MDKRYCQDLLSDEQWAQIRPIVPHPHASMFDTRAFVECILWYIEQQRRWRNVERYDWETTYPHNWKTVHKRYARWCKMGVWEKIFEALANDPSFRFHIQNGYMTRKAGRGRRDEYKDGRDNGLRVRPNPNWNKGRQ